MIHAVTLLVVLLALGRWASAIPLAVLAAILAVVAYHMSEWHSWKALARAPRSDVVVLLVTFLLTVLVDLTVAVQAGVVLAAFLFMKRMADVTNVGAISREFQETPDGTMTSDPDGVARRVIPEGVEIYEVNGPFFFGAADKIRDVLGVVAKKPQVFILRLRNVPAIDATGIRVLDDLSDTFRHQGIRFILAGLHAQPLVALDRAGRLDRYGRENLAGDIDEALSLAREATTSPRSAGLE
jgi:SulP family sulfate permease